MAAGRKEDRRKTPKSAAKKKRKITPKESCFIDQYLILNNGTQAAKAAKYSERTARQAAARLLSNVYIQEEIERRRQKIAERTEITQEKVLEELALLSFSNVDHYTIDDSGKVKLTEDAPEGAMRAISSIKRKKTILGTGKNKRTLINIELKLWDKPGPLKLVGQHVGLFSKRVEVTGRDGQPVKLDTGLSQEALDAIEARILGKEVK